MEPRRRQNMFSKIFKYICSSPDPTILDHPRRNINQHYQLHQLLGAGSFGKTYLCGERSTGSRYACKIVPKDKIRSGEVDATDLRQEVKILKTIPSHPHIINIKETFEDSKNVYLIMELCEGGELLSRVGARPRGHLEEDESKSIVKSLIQVIQWLNVHGIMHRDIKPANLLLGQNDIVKTIDFGFATFYRPGQRFRDRVGTPGYMAPEIFLRNYGPEVDIWSAGVLLYEILCGYHLFSLQGDIQTLKERTFRFQLDFSSEPWPRVSNEAKDLIRGMLDRNPVKRLTPCQILNHPWLRNGSTSGSSNLRSVRRQRPVEEDYSHRTNYSR